MHPLQVLRWTAVALAIGYATSVPAQSLRCNGDLAGVGDSKASLFQKCGKPAFQDSFCKPVDTVQTVIDAAGNTIVLGPGSCQQIDEWTYFPGSGQFVTTFRLEGGVVKSVKYGDRIN
jgi:hypothetical protein